MAPPLFGEPLSHVQLGQPPGKQPTLHVSAHPYTLMGLYSSIGSYSCAQSLNFLCHLVLSRYFILPQSLSVVYVHFTFTTHIQNKLDSLLCEQSRRVIPFCLQTPPFKSCGLSGFMGIFLVKTPAKQLDVQWTIRDKVQTCGLKQPSVCLAFASCWPRQVACNCVPLAQWHL